MSQTNVYPLDPLTTAELTDAVKILHAHPDWRPTWRLHQARLDEPDKVTLQNGTADRSVFFVARDPGGTYEVVVSLTRECVLSFKRVENVQPSLTADEYGDVERVVKADAGWRNAVKRRGLTDEEIALVQVDGVSCGNFGIEADLGKRLVGTLAYYRAAIDDNGYAHPIEGVVAYVDLDTRTVHRLVDSESLAAIPRTSGLYDARSVTAYRTGLETLEIVQPQGPSFQVDGHTVAWQNWSFRVSFNSREGLVLHRIGYFDQGRVRPILYRASISEMVVPYGDPRPGHYWMSVFDQGEYGLGAFATSLELGCDCLGSVRYFDAVQLRENGEPYIQKNVVCLHEEDYGVLWKHRDLNSSVNETRRSRRLVVSFFCTVGNYDYGFFWYFYQDGTIQLETKLTGVLQPAGVVTGEEYPYGTLLAPNLGAPLHQHLFCARLHWDLDGGGNSVYEVQTESVPWGENNRYGTAFTARSRLLANEAEAMRLADPLSARNWRVVNPTVRNWMGEAVGYKLIPQASPLLLSQPDSVVAKRAAFATRHLWVTPYHPREWFAAGEYPYASTGDDGLATWTRQNRSLENADLVMWHTFGTTHNARLEDYPVMPVEYAGFVLKPHGFFDRNPALDVPAPHHHSANGHD